MSTQIQPALVPVPLTREAPVMVRFTRRALIVRDGEPLPDQDLRAAAWGVLLAEVHAARTAPGSTDRPQDAA